MHRELYMLYIYKFVALHFVDVVSRSCQVNFNSNRAVKFLKKLFWNWKIWWRRSLLLCSFFFSWISGKLQKNVLLFQRLRKALTQFFPKPEIRHRNEKPFVIKNRKFNSLFLLSITTQKHKFSRDKISTCKKYFFVPRFEMKNDWRRVARVRKSEKFEAWKAWSRKLVVLLIKTNVFVRSISLNTWHYH